MPNRTSVLARARAGWRRCPCQRNEMVPDAGTAKDLGQQVGDGDGRVRERERRYALIRTEGLRAPVAPTEERGAVRNGPAIDLQAAVREIHDPVVGEAGARVEAALAVAVEPETGERDVDHENGARRVRVAIVARIAGDDADVRLRLRLVVQRHRHLGQDVPARPQRAGENAHDQADGRGVKTVLLFHPRPLPFFHVHRGEGNAYHPRAGGAEHGEDREVRRRRRVRSVGLQPGHQGHGRADHSLHGRPGPLRRKRGREASRRLHGPGARGVRRHPGARRGRRRHPREDTMSDEATLRALAMKVRNWGRWGPDDEIGTLNYITPDTIAAAGRLVTTGKVFALGIPLDRQGPQSGTRQRFNPIHTMFRDGGDAPRTPAQVAEMQGYGGSDDWIVMPLQCVTQWDSLAHIFYEGKMYNGYDATLVTSSGAAKNSIDKTRDKIVGRGVLLDVAAYRGVGALEPGYAITVEDLEATAAAAKVSVQPSDLLSIRTGHMSRYLDKNDWRHFDLDPSPAVSVHTAVWMHDKQIAAVASDNYAVELRPSALPAFRNPFHVVAIANMGLTLGEIFFLEELAADCAADGRTRSSSSPRPC